MPFSCEECNCHNHSSSCQYNAVVDRANMSLNTNGELSGGGVCQDCQSSTEGINCELCDTFYYLPDGNDINSQSPCLPCECDQKGIRNTTVLVSEFGDCVKETGGGFSAGDCICKTNVGGTARPIAQLSCMNCIELFVHWQVVSVTCANPCFIICHWPTPVAAEAVIVIRLVQMD